MGPTAIDVPHADGAHDERTDAAVYVDLGRERAVRRDHALAIERAA
jgi:hypothetical protein